MHFNPLMWKLCPCVLTTAQDTTAMADAQELYIKFVSILLQFSKCHSLNDCTTITPDMIKCLGKCLIYQLCNAQGVSFFKNTYGHQNVVCNSGQHIWGHEESCKMHLLKDHMVDWLSTHQVGCGVMGEQGVKSIHAKFNSLAQTYSGTRDPKLMLKSIMKEHYSMSHPSSRSRVGGAQRARNPPPVS